MHASNHEHDQKWNCEAYSSVRGANLEGAELLNAIATDSIHVTGRGRKNLVTRAKSLANLLATAPDDLRELVNLLFDPTVADEAEDVEKRAWASRDLALLRSIALSRVDAGLAVSLTEVMEHLRYQIATRAPLTEPEGHQILITTLHSAKGLQHQRVIMAGIADQIIPGPTEDLEEREERRRLLYVALTRARNELVVSWPLRMKFGEATQNLVRIDEVVTIRGEAWAKLSSSSLLPQQFPGTPRNGNNWLATSGIT